MEKRRHREIDVLGIKQVRRRCPGMDKRADQRHAQAVALIQVVQAGDLEVLSKKQGSEFLRLPGKAALHHGELEASPIGSRQLQVSSGIELADSLCCPDTFGKPCVIEIARQAETRIKSR